MKDENKTKARQAQASSLVHRGKSEQHKINTVTMLGSYKRATVQNKRKAASRQT